MSYYKLTNISGGQIVCDLAVEGETLRLDNKKSETIRESKITPHINNLVEKKLILMEEVSIPETKTTKNTAKKSSSKEKED